MKDCKKIRKDLVAYLYKEKGEKEKHEIEKHLDSCAECMRKFNELKDVLLCADAVKKDIDQAVESVDWDTLPSKIADQVLSPSHHKKRQESKFKRILNSVFTVKLVPVYAALLAGIIIGGVLTFMILRPGGMTEEAVPSPSGFMVSRDVLDTMDLEMARRETLDYLEQSKFLLIDFVQTPPDESSSFWKSEFVEAKTSELLSKKKYINQQLDKHHMAKAKAICDQIEILLLELAGMSGELSSAERARIQELIEQRQLLLKINLIKKELQQQQSEV